MLLLGLAAIVTLFTILWLVSLRLEDSSIVDIAWGPGILFLSLIYYFTSDGAPPRARLTLALLLAYALLFGSLPPMLRASLGLTALAALCSQLYLGCRLSAPLWGLLQLGLPLEASLQFYLGQPLRLLATEVAAALLRGLGIAVQAEGTQLASGAVQVLVDAPCSGISSLRMALVAGCALALVYRVSAPRWAGALLLTAALALLGNALRSASLFLLEADILHAGRGGEALHSGAGLAVFAALLLTQAWVLGRAARASSAAT